VASSSVDVVVLGAGFVGVSAALQLQARGRSVVIVDRLGAIAGETSYGNAGIVQAEAVFPYVFPRSPIDVIRGALNLDPRAQIRYSALPWIAPSVMRYFLASTPARRLATARAMAGLVGRATEQHRAFARDAQAGDLLREGGWIKAYRSAKGEDSVHKEIEELKPFGIKPVLLDRKALSELEPNVSPLALGGAHYADPLSTPNPQGLAERYAGLFIERGGRLEKGDARTLEASGGGWTVATVSGPLNAKAAVVALGPWSTDVTEGLGYKLPMFAKRGYHMHYSASGNAGVNRPVLDLERGYVIAPMARGLRLTTGAEFARRDDLPSSVHIDRLEPFAREMFPLGARLEPQPWLGRRPCMPDMRPVIGPAPRHANLWFDFGHHHLGLTLGPVSGLLLAEMMTGETPFIDPKPFAADRFG
jgi:D-amino-acid dehydrogenase